MRRVLAAAVLASLTGCSNAPIAGLLDCCAPAQAQKGIRAAEPVVPPRDAGGRVEPLPPGADVIPPVGPPR